MRSVIMSGQPQQAPHRAKWNLPATSSVTPVGLVYMELSDRGTQSRTRLCQHGLTLHRYPAAPSLFFLLICFMCMEVYYFDFISMCTLSDAFY